MRRHLVVGNQTLTSTELLQALQDRAAAESSSFHVLVPMRHREGTWAWSEGGDRAAAEARLVEALDRFREAGLNVTGQVGDTNPVAAVSDILLIDPDFEEIIVSTFPPGVSFWLGQDVPHRVAREHPGVPVAHVISEPAHAM